MNRTWSARTLSLLVLLALTALSACGVQVHDVDAVLPGAAIDDPAVTTTTEVIEVEDPVPMDIEGDNGDPLNVIAGTAIHDLETWWAKEYPIVYDGAYKPLTGKMLAYDSGTDPLDMPCGINDVESALNNAFYCPEDDAVAWDQEALMPDMASKYGDFTVAFVLAHEWGHVIQDQTRADVRAKPITLELQADCFAGAWVSHVRHDRPTYFAVDDKTLDQALAGILSLKDLPGQTTAASPDAHGSGFDRIGSFQDGYENGVVACAEMSDENTRPYLFEWGANDASTEGNMPYDDRTRAGKTTDGIVSSTFKSLDGYWKDTFPELSGGTAWKPLDPARPFTDDKPASCDGAAVTGYRLFFCAPDNYIGYSDEALRTAYDRDGDFAVSALIATQYGLDAQMQLGLDVDSDPVVTTLRGDCFAGAWGAALIETSDNTVPEDYVLVLSPGDLDEGVSVLLSFRTDSDRQRQGPGFDRVRAFSIGVKEGAEACVDVTAGS